MIYKYLLNYRKKIDTKLIYLLSAFYGIFLLVALIRALYFRYFVFTGKPERSLTQLIFGTYILDLFLVVIFMLIVSIQTKKLINKHIKWSKIILIHIIYSILIGVFVRVMSDVVNVFIGQLNFADYDIRDTFFRFMSTIHMNFLVYFAMTFIIYTYYYLERNRMSQLNHNILQKKLVDTKLLMLKAQLQPHFLFNTLNSISSLVKINTDKAQDTIVDLSEFLRELLDENNKLITLEKELRVLDHYLNILRIRFEEQLIITSSVDGNLVNKLVPPFIIQPLIENSVKHGLSYSHDKLKIDLIIKETKNSVTIKVSNNGSPLKFEQKHVLRNGIGLSNIDERLRTIYGENYRFEIRNRTNHPGVESVIMLPN